MYSTYYSEVLYPEQDRVLNILKNCELPFYLTGGTAVSRGYLNHRYSDDLDLFVNNDTNFQTHIEKAITTLESVGFSIDFYKTSSPDFTRIFVDRNKNGLDKKGLKIDFVNDIPAHFGEISESPVYYRTDSIRNILSNKYTALYRISAKDAVDICAISENYPFKWADIIKEAEQKEGGIDGKEIVQIFSCFSDKDFENINWIEKTDIKDFKNNIAIIAKDMLEEKENSLFKECTIKKFMKELKNIIPAGTTVSDLSYVITFQSIVSKISTEKKQCIGEYLTSQGATSEKELPNVLRKLASGLGEEKHIKNSTQTIDDHPSISD